VVEVVATSEDASSAPLVADLKQAAEAPDLVVRLTNTGTIGGVVVDGRGDPVAQAVVTCTPFQVEAVGVRPVVVESTDASGRFTCRALPPGDCQVQATRPFSPNTVHPGLRGVGQRARTGTRNLRLVVPADGALRLRVRRPDGAPARSFTVGLVQGLPPLAVTTENGEYLVTGLPPRTYYLTIRSGDLVHTRPVTVREGETTVIDDIVLEPFAPSPR
jgi:hypothetical protein